MKLLCTIGLLFLTLVARAEVVRLAPNFTWDGPARSNSLRAVKGQPVVLLIAKSARTGAFRAQLKKLRPVYREFASRKAIFVAAVADGGEVRSDIPFAPAKNGAQIAELFGVNEKFTIVIIGRDGNIDYQTDRVLPATRVRDVLANSFTEQSDRRK
ncbi:MAG: hypothetical protein QOD99_1225 [Chthoniobacter sp.]|jgi:hypothetical protein|nr:hypothetical protein [Chthoniobacter sp.]